MPRAVLLPAVWALASFAAPPAVAAPPLLSRYGHVRPLSRSSATAGSVDTLADLRSVTRSVPGTPSRPPIGNISRAHDRVDAGADHPRTADRQPKGTVHLLLDGIAEPFELLVRLVPAVASIESLLPPPMRSSAHRALGVAAHGYLLHELRKLSMPSHPGPSPGPGPHWEGRRGGLWELDTWEWVAIGAGLATAAVGATLLIRSEGDAAGSSNRTRSTLAALIFGGVRLSLDDDRGWIQIRGRW